MLDVIDRLQEQFRNKCTQEESGHSIEATKSKCQDCNHQASRKSNQHSIVKTKHILISPFESFRFKFPATELFKHSGSNDKGIDVFTSFGRGRVFLQTDVFVMSVDVFDCERTIPRKCKHPIPDEHVKFVLLTMRQFMTRDRSKDTGLHSLGILPDYDAHDWDRRYSAFRDKWRESDIVHGCGTLDRWALIDRFHLPSRGMRGL